MHFKAGGGYFLSKLKNRDEFEGGLHVKRIGKGGKRRKKKRLIKHVIIPLLSLSDRKNKEEF